ncbi:MAG: tetratricopeptide repeat protein [Spirochaetes bacterium]|nr:tetratricopeptide repeat protein [Spirochaetota bacterium]
MKYISLKWILLTSIILFLPVLIFGDELTKGNSYYHQQKYDAALTAYEKAEVSQPESPYVYFNKGTAFYKMQDYLKAKEQFQLAATKTRDLKIESLANYNTGNAVFMEAERQKDSDLEKSIQLYQESIEHYSRALELDKDLSKAAYNIEITRLIVKDLLDKLKNQQEQTKEQREKQQEILENLQKIAKKQGTINNTTSQIQKAQQQTGLTPQLAQALKNMNKEQKNNQNQTAQASADIDEVLKELAEKQALPPQSPLTTAKDYVDQAVNYQGLAQNKLAGQDAEEAQKPQKQALAALEKAIEELTKNDHSQEQQNQQQQQEQQEPSPQEEEQSEENQQDQNKEEQQDQQQAEQEAAQILAEEQQNQEEREKEQTAVRYYAPSKDW